MTNMFAVFRAVDTTLSRRDELPNAPVLPDQDVLTVHDFSEVLGWLIIKTQEGGVDVRDQRSSNEPAPGVAVSMGVETVSNLGGYAARRKGRPAGLSATA